MNKSLLITIVSIVGLAIAWWLISPLWRNKKLDEPLPSASTPKQTLAPQTIEDNLDTMDGVTRERFKKETQDMANHAMPGSDAMPLSSSLQAPVILARAPMIARAHDVEGKAFLVQTEDKKILRFENLKTINGPDLRIYLSTGLNVADALDLGPIRATQGNVNYTIPEGADITKYKNALIWCRAFGVLFSYAQF